MVRARIASAVILSLVTSVAGGVDLVWDPVTEDVDGAPVASDSILYRPYWSTDNIEWVASSLGSIAERTVPLDGLPPGCYYFSVSAIRTDASPQIEGGRSTPVYYCSGEAPLPPPPPPPTQQPSVAAPEPPDGVNVQ